MTHVCILTVKVLEDLTSMHQIRVGTLVSVTTCSQPRLISQVHANRNQQLRFIYERYISSES